MIINYILSGITVISFIFAMLAVPVSDANALGGGILYPYLDTIGQYPRDFIWQYWAIILMVAYIVLYTVLNGLDKNDGFEVLIISVSWILLIIDGILLGSRVKKGRVFGNI